MGPHYLGLENIHEKQKQIAVIQKYGRLTFMKLHDV